MAKEEEFEYPTRVDGYDFRGEIGSGAFATVFMATVKDHPDVGFIAWLFFGFHSDHVIFAEESCNQSS